MGLVNCTTCDRSVSDTSATCYHCGSPIVVVQKTHTKHHSPEVIKKLKIHSAISSCLMVGSILWILGALDAGSIEILVLPAFVAITSISWFFVTKCRIWALEH